MRDNPRSDIMKQEFIRLSRSAEDYLECIGHLCREKGAARVQDIAQRLDVKKPSVTVAVRRLAEQGLVQYRQYAPIELTSRGEEYAEKVIQAHSILRRFMREVAGLSRERANEIACLMEHLLTYEEIHSLSRRLPHSSDS